MEMKLIIEIDRKEVTIRFSEEETPKTSLPVKKTEKRISIPIRGATETKSAKKEHHFARFPRIDVEKFIDDAKRLSRRTRNSTKYDKIIRNTALALKYGRPFTHYAAANSTENRMMSRIANHMGYRRKKKHTRKYS